MPGRGDQESEARFSSFVEALAAVIGHADRASPLRDYCTGLLMPAEIWASHWVATRRKSLVANSSISEIPLVPGAVESSLWLAKVGQFQA